ncbi:hypothetical protein A2960_03120 [Candidatus Gottesmanbacteria bacterium RIFCSPLOWO2_01_FULL_39_12b]|uniref:Peptidase M50 domain-containing protein n=1 Tax=Candidatus Gottesmanbacteria bacterium RIFCSPLOWO2_01_FULL_39_12b TaxID=1798388 RepID=A0A1F6AR01_9BACT|nr:MAG: hypothetical protein A2960_03120 [Candidatus Gottesmanbacteria bacterium RIFCSPLOWO2_01_FULL_39_12b]
MLDILAKNPIEFIIIAALLVAAISIHEFSHALAADHLGDPTPRIAGRLTLNPKAHLDPLGTVLLFLFGFGWGKPVPFDPFNLREPRRDAALISFVGPLSNLIMAITSAIILRFTTILPSLTLSVFISDILSMFIYFNVLLAIFNLIPVHPLDGFKVVAGILPHKYYSDWLELERYGMIFLIMLIFPFMGSSAITTIISPIVRFIISLLLPAKIGGVI